MKAKTIAICATSVGTGLAMLTAGMTTAAPRTAAPAAPAVVTSVKAATAPPVDVHNDPSSTAVSSKVKFLDNVQGVAGGYSGLNFIKYKAADYMFANGPGGLAVWSLKSPTKPKLVSTIPAADLRQPGDTTDRFWEGENMTVDAKRKLVFLSRDPRGFGGKSPTGLSGVYIIDVKNPAKPTVVVFHPIPAGHTSTCINDCQYLWTQGPSASGVPGNDPNWKGVPVWVTDIRNPKKPKTFAKAIDQNRFDGITNYVHSVDVDKNGVAWVSGEGGVRGYWTEGVHFDPVSNRYRIAKANAPVPYAGGTVEATNPEGTEFYDYFDHNAYHPTNKVGDFKKGSLLYITNENIRECSTAGEFKVASLQGSMKGEGWKSTAEDPLRLKLLSHWSPWGQPGSATTGSCSAHWFTVNGNIVTIAWYGQGTRFLDMSNPAKPKQVGYFRVPAGDNVVGGSASAAYWHNGLIYVADYRRGVDVLLFTGKLAGSPDKKICWNACDK